MVKGKKRKKGELRQGAHAGNSSRKLAAIMFTDMVGYTALGQKNEALSLALVIEQRRLLRPIFKMHNGREIKTIGDAFLVEFQSALEGVRCAYDIQRTVREYNISLPEDGRFALRIGVHLGDVIKSKDGDIAGDAVNVASRIEPLAENGGVCLTRQVYDDVQNKLDTDIQSIGFKSLKNVSKPIEVYKLTMPWQEKSTKLIPPRVTLKKNASQFFGREKEISLLFDQLNSVIEEARGSVVLVGGEAGIGKTSLVESFISKLPMRETVIVRGYCLAEISIPYFPFVKALSTLLQDKGDGNSVGIVNWFIDPQIISNTSASTKEQVFELIVRKLSEESFKKTLILFLDDLHWADSASLALLHYLARNTKDRRVLILGTYRSEELADLGQGNPHPLSETIRLMNREGLILKLELPRLAAETIHEVTSSIIKGASNPVLELIAKESEGNPFYAVESSRFLLDSGALESISGSYVMKESGAKIQVPSSILDVIGRRLGRLRDEERQLVNCASIIGEHFDPRIVASALGLDELNTIQAFANLSRNTRMVLEEGESFRFEHAKIKESVNRELGVALSNALHRRVAAAIISLYGAKSVQELAYHYHAAGMKDKTIEFGIIAGDQAKAQFAYAESVTCYGWVIEAADEVEMKASALAKRAESLSLQGLHQQAIKDSNLALEISKSSSARFLALRVSAVSWQKMGHFTNALDCINKAESEHGQDKMDYLKLLEVKAVILSRKNDPNAEAVWKELGRGYLDAGGKKEYAQAILALDESPNTKDPVQIMYEALKINEEIGDLAGQAEVYCNLADYITLNSGEIREAEENYRKGIELAKKIGNFDLIVWAYLYWGILLEAVGNYEESLAMGLKSIEAANLAEAPYPETGACCVVVRCYLRLNKFNEAEKAFAKMNDLYEKHSKDSSQGMLSFVARTRGFRFAYLSNWKDADDAYKTSVNLLGGGWGAHEPNSRREYAQWLIKQNRRNEALEELRLAFTKYQKLQNKHGMETTQEMMKKIEQR